MGFIMGLGGGFIVVGVPGARGADTLVAAVSSH